MALFAPTTIAAAAGIGMYLNGKHHIVKDLKSLYAIKRGQWKFESAVKHKRINIFQSFTAQVDRLQDEDCIWTPQRRFSWTQTRQQVLRYAHWFLSQGVQRGDIVAFYLQNSAEFMFAWLALIAINAAPAMVNFNLEGKGLVHCIKVSEARMILIDEEIQDRALMNDEVVGMGLSMVVLTSQLKTEIEALEPRELDESVMAGTDEKSMLALRYTSGTTGFPKCVRTPMSRTYQLVYGKFDEMGLKPGPGGDRWYICMPMCHATAGSTVMACMIMGITLCIGKRFSTSNFWREVRDSRATLLVYVGEVCRYLLTNPPTEDDRNHNVRMMYGNGLRPDVWRIFRDRFGIPEISELFGSTEGVITMVNSAKGDYLANAIGHHGSLLRRYYQNIYIPVEIDHETGEVVRDPLTGFAQRNSYTKGGEIIVAVPSKAAFLGYYKNPSATEKRFLHDVFKKGDFYYRCGDALRRSDDGKWFFLDRLGDTFRWKSENVSTAEVSEVLGSFPGVIDANVYGVEVPYHDGRAGCAALLLDPEKQSGFDLQGLLKHAQRDLPGYAVPVFLRIVKEPSMNHTHKQSKTKLREEGVNPAMAGEDQLYVLQNGRYVQFTPDHWTKLAGGTARL